MHKTVVNNFSGPCEFTFHEGSMKNRFVRDGKKKFVKKENRKGNTDNKGNSTKKIIKQKGSEEPKKQDNNKKEEKFKLMKALKESKEAKDAEKTAEIKGQLKNLKKTSSKICYSVCVREKLFNWVFGVNSKTALEDWLLLQQLESVYGRIKKFVSQENADKLLKVISEAQENSSPAAKIELLKCYARIIEIDAKSEPLDRMDTDGSVEILSNQLAKDIAEVTKEAKEKKE